MEIQTQHLNQLIKEFFAQFEIVWVITIENYLGKYREWGQDSYMLFDNEQEAFDKFEELNNKTIRLKISKGIPCEIVNDEPILLTPDNIHDYMGIIIKELCS